MKAVALTIEALALLNNEERKKERKKERSAKWHFGQFQFTSLSFRMVLDSRKVQLGMIMKARYFLKL